MSKGASPALCRTPDSGTQRAEAIGFEVPDATLAWRCRSDCQGRVPRSLADYQRSGPLFDVTEVQSKALFLRRPAMATVRRECGLVVQRPRRSLQPGTGQSCERLPETPTGRPTEQRRYQERP